MAVSPGRAAQECSPREALLPARVCEGLSRNMQGSALWLPHCHSGKQSEPTSSSARLLLLVQRVSVQNELSPTSQPSRRGCRRSGVKER